MSKIDSLDDSISILYVEDDLNSREELSSIFSYRYPDVRLFVSDNGESGLELFNKHQPEIVITDINMPIANGIKMAGEIKTLAPSVEVIALTAHANTQYLLQAIKIGISNYLLKPVDLEQLFKTIDKILASIQSERLITRQNDIIMKLNSELIQKAMELENKNKELESFDYSVAHDLRTPMINISTLSRKLLGMQSRLDDECTGCLRAIELEISTIDSIINALLKLSVFSRIHVDKKWIDLSKIVHGVCEKLQQQEPNHHVTFCVADGVNGYCDFDQMIIVLKNLLDNAWKYRKTDSDSCIEFGTINTEEDLVYFIRDNGVGFDQEESETLFIPFQRLQCNDRVEGLGIGLATVDRIIKHHGGRIWADGKKGVGSTFYFTL